MCRDLLISEYTVFASMNISKRMPTVLKHRLCFICLDNKHPASKCGSLTYCEICNGRHHTLIHLQREMICYYPLLL